MRIAITYDYDTKEVFQHFGQTQYFLLAEIYDDNNLMCRIVDNGGQSHGGLVSVLQDLEVDVLICGGIGMHAINLLNEAKIKVIPGIVGDAVEAAKEFFDGNLKADMSALHECDCGHEQKHHFDA